MHVFLELAVNEEDLGFQKFDILALVKHGSFQVLVLSLHVVVLKLELDNVVVGLDILVNAVFCVFGVSVYYGFQQTTLLKLSFTVRNSSFVLEANNFAIQSVADVEGVHACLHTQHV